MSVTQVPLQPLKKGSMLKLWLGIALVAAVAIALAWLGTGRFRGDTTPNGILIRTLDAGKGDPIRMNDGVLLSYDGRLAANDETFDTSNGEPVPMLPSQVIPGFGEALTMMKEGGSYTIRIPGALAYGPKGTPDGRIPPNAALIFDVKIHQVVRDAALMMQQMAPQGEAPQGAPPAPPQP